MRHWILSRMIHCPCENELVYLPEKTVMFKEKWLLGKYKHNSTVMNGAEAMKHTGPLVLAPAIFAHRNYSKLPGYVCSVPSSHFDKTPAHTCANHSWAVGICLHTSKLAQPLWSSRGPMWWRWMIWTCTLAYLSSEPYRATSFKFCCLFCSA